MTIKKRTDGALGTFRLIGEGNRENWEGTGCQGNGGRLAMTCGSLRRTSRSKLLYWWHYLALHIGGSALLLLLLLLSLSSMFDVVVLVDDYEIPGYQMHITLLPTQ